MKKRPAKRARRPEASPTLAARVVVLAAGVGSRMRSALPKVLHRVAGRTLLEAVLDAAEALSPSRVVVVVGPERQRIEGALAGRSVRFAVQDPPLGTGDAVARAREALGDDGGPVVVLAGDTPLLRAETLARLVARQREKHLDLVFLTFRPPESGDFGRVIRDRRGRPAGIVEARNATAREKRIRDVNAGVYCFDPEALTRALGKIGRNRVTGEYYLTDAVAILAAGGRVEAIEAEDWREAWGVNTRRDLAAAEEIERRRGVERALDSGVTVLDPSTLRVGPRVAFAPDVVIHPFVCLEGNTTLAEGSEVLPFTRLVDTRLEKGAVIGPHCEADRAEIGPEARVGPHARLRPGAVLERGVKIGNFVEIKNTVVRQGAKAQHLAYLGDADIGAGANVGAGVITCNYDGTKKHRTTIGEGAFVGTDSQLVAPVTVGRGAYVAAGTTVTEDVPDGALAISRAPQVNKEGWVERRKARKSE